MSEKFVIGKDGISGKNLYCKFEYGFPTEEPFVVIRKSEHENIINTVGALLTEIDTYLSVSKKEQIGSDSIFHREIKELISQLTTVN